MFPVEQPAESNDIAREMRGYTSSNKEGSLFKLLNEDVEKLVDNTWNKMWSRFITIENRECMIYSYVHNYTTR